MKSPTAQLSVLAAGLQDDPEFSPSEEPAFVRYTLQQVLQWTEARVCQWLREQGFSRYESTFRDNLITGEALVELDYNLLKELSVRTVGERVRLNLAIKHLRHQCLQVDVESEPTGKSKRSVTLDAHTSPGALTPQTGAELSPVPMSALRNSHNAAATAAGTATASGSPTSAVKQGSKDLPVLPRVSLSSTAIGINGGNSGSSSMQRANTDMRTVAGHDRRSSARHQLSSQTIGGVTMRKPKGSSHDKSSKLAQPLTVAPLMSINTHKPGSKSSSSKENNGAKSPPQSSSKLSLKTNPGGNLGVVLGAEPMSAPLPRMRMLSNTLRQGSAATSPPLANSPLQALKDALESKHSSSRDGKNEDIERLGLQFQEIFGTDISVANLADSLSVKTFQVSITGPENQACQVSITVGSSATTILDKIRREFDLDNDSDGDQYSLFSMTSEGGGARCLSNDELVKMFSNPDVPPPERFFLRKRHQISRPPMGFNRSEHLQRAIERLGNKNAISPQQQQQQQQSQSSWTSSKWETTTDKLTKILGERPPSELVSMNVEKYFPGNEARARHSIMRRRRHESQEALSPESNEAGIRPSRRGSKSHRRSSSSSSTSSRIMRDRLKALAIGGEKTWSQFSSSLEPIEESLASPGIVDERAPASLAEAAADTSAEIAASVPSAEKQPDGASMSEPEKEADAESNKTHTTSEAATLPTATVTSRQNKRLSKIFTDTKIELVRSPSCESLQFSDDDSTGSLSDLSSSSSQLSDSFESDDDSFYKSLGDSDIDGDEDLADDDSDTQSLNLPAESAQNGVHSVADDATGGTFGKPASKENAEGVEHAATAVDGQDGAGERHNSVSRSISTASRSARAHAKKKTWIKGAPIASGSFGSVYFGMNTRTGAIMAVKEVELPKPGSVSMNRNQKMADALRHELDLLKGLDHKNVVKYLGTDMDDRNIYIFLEYVSGGSVSSALASFGMFPESLVQTYTSQILEGLVYLHDQGIIHRDIKGGNVLIDQDGSVKISDFGISKRVDEVVAASKMDRRASLQGSVFWMAPEVVKDTKYTVKGDVWSLGCLVIEMITGTHPFPDLDQMQALYSIGQRSRPKIPSDMSEAGQDFLEQALQVDLDKRPTATDLVGHRFVSDTDPPSP
ncbi:ATP binding [Coemansia erecta]|uniref:mitogen-activated protein kinase kinase kinase n=1 Tax=Coemansia erecta TaxID=147472 RepID=A0A9W7Y183_9FUNG|nr:ATP binding [Coemansia erecta]